MKKKKTFWKYAGDFLSFSLGILVIIAMSALTTVIFIVTVLFFLLAPEMEELLGGGVVSLIPYMVLLFFKIFEVSVMDAFIYLYILPEVKRLAKELGRKNGLA